ncbi:MAG: beta-L-arabinofuranosidase domain-containing protein [Bacteroidales bacterium]
MKNLTKLFLFLVATSLFIQSCQTHQEKQIQTDGREVVSFKALPFELNQVRLLEGPFRHATELNQQSLLNYKPDRFLADFRNVADLETRAEDYHGWEDETLAGHSLGHYLSACSMMYKTTGDSTFCKRVNYIVDDLMKCQKADSDGFIGAVTDTSVKRIFEQEIAKGEIRSKGFDLNGIWAPLYTMHKQFAGLLDAYKLCGNEKALKVAANFADWLGNIVDQLNDEQMEEMLHCEHGGINEAMANLYAATGNERYLSLARRFYHKKVLDPLSKGIDNLAGKHANTQIPKLTGLARIHEFTGDTSKRNTAEFFWKTVVNHHSYVTGGNGNEEYFGPADSLRDELGQNTTESCNVYNMLKLTRHLFQYDASARKADFYERALLNHILSSQHHRDGRVIYNLPLAMGGYKEYQDPHWFTCCVGTGMENHSKYGRNIYFHNNRELYVSQFIASKLNWQEKGIILTQQTDYPEEQGTSFIFECNEPTLVALKIRYPYWAKKGMEVYVNGKKQNISEDPQSFVEIEKKWKSGDRVKVKFPFSLRLESMPDDKDRAAIMYGPLVLAGDLGPVKEEDTVDSSQVPVFRTDDRNPANWTVTVENEPNTFKTEEVGRPGDVKLRPFYGIIDRRYSVYFDFVSQQEWEER